MPRRALSSRSRDRHLPTRAKDEIGRAIKENKHRTLSCLHCDVFVLRDDTKVLEWPKEASTSDAMLLAIFDRMDMGDDHLGKVNSDRTLTYKEFAKKISV